MKGERNCFPLIREGFQEEDTWAMQGAESGEWRGQRLYRNWNRVFLKVWLPPCITSMCPLGLKAWHGPLPFLVAPHPGLLWRLVESPNMLLTYRSPLLHLFCHICMAARYLICPLLGQKKCK